MNTPSGAQDPLTPTADQTDGSPNADQLADAYQQGTHFLQKLQEDVAVFRDPQMRNYLETIPIRSVIGAESIPENITPSRETHAQQQAMIIALRTKVAEVESALEQMKNADLRSRKRAARAEGELAELTAQYKTQERTLRSSVDTATSRIRSMQNDAASSNKAVEDERSRLAERIDQLRVEVRNTNASRDSALAQQSAISSRMHTLENQLLALQKAHAVEKRALQSARDGAKEREDGLQREVDQLRAARRLSEGVEKEELVKSNRLVEKLQEEVVQLSSELKWVSTKSERSEKNLNVAEDEKDKLREQMRAMRERGTEANQLRNAVARMEESSAEADDALRKVTALAKEKEELCGLIGALTETRNVQDGLTVLRKLAKMDSRALEQVLNGDSPPERVDVEMVDRENVPVGKSCESETEALQTKCDKLQIELTGCRGELESISSTKERTDRLCKMLVHEVSHLKASLSDMQEQLSGKGTSLDVQNRMSELKSLENDYGKLIGELELKIAEKEKQIEQLKISASPDVTSHQTTELAITKYEDRIASLEEELKEERLHQVKEEGEKDFDSKVLKVVHFDENPLSCAIANWKEEQRKLRGKKRSRVSESPLRDSASAAEVEEVRKEMAEIRGQFDELNRRAVMGDRTRNVALKRIEEVRCAVYNLFGWSMKVSGAMYKLSSIYAETPDEVLHFCVNEAGTMSLVDSEYAQRLGKELDQFVYRMNSFPALLSHVTMENFEKTTLFTA